MTPHSYATPAAFKEALEQRLRSAGLADVSRRRQLLVFDRLLARIMAAFGDAAVLKGGLALELRLERARTTKDIDLRMMGSPDDLLPRLQALAQLDLGDFMTFEIEPDPHHPEIQNEGMRYEGLRFRAESRIAGKLYGQRFGVDIAFGDPIHGEPDLVVANDVLAFAGIAPPTLRLYPSVWKTTKKKTTTHNRFYATVEDRDAAVCSTFETFKAQPSMIAGQRRALPRDPDPTRFCLVVGTGDRDLGAPREGQIEERATGSPRPRS